MPKSKKLTLAKAYYLSRYYDIFPSSLKSQKELIEIIGDKELSEEEIPLGAREYYQEAKDLVTINQDKKDLLEILSDLDEKKGDWRARKSGLVAKLEKEFKKRCKEKGIPKDSEIYEEYKGITRYIRYKRSLDKTPKEVLITRLIRKILIDLDKVTQDYFDKTLKAKNLNGHLSNFDLGKFCYANRPKQFPYYQLILDRVSNWSKDTVIYFSERKDIMEYKPKSLKRIRQITPVQTRLTQQLKKYKKDIDKEIHSYRTPNLFLT